MGMMVQSGRFAAPGGGGWDPVAALPNLYAWFDSSQQPEANLGQLSTFIDQGPNGLDFTDRSGTHTGPHLVHAGLDGKAITRWGRNTADSGNVSTALDRPDANFLAGLTSAAVMMLVKADNDPASGGTDGGFQGRMHNHGGDCHVPYGDGNCYTGFGSTSRYTFNPSPSLANWHLWYEETSPTAATGWKCFINEVQIYASASNTVQWASGNYRYMGRGNAGGSSGTWRGRVAEIFYFDNIPGTSERQEAAGGMLWKWAQQALLPSGHPYESVAP